MLRQTFRPLQPHEVVRAGDLVEDLETGQYEHISTEGYYAFLRGQKAHNARLMPSVNDVLRQSSKLPH